MLERDRLAVGDCDPDVDVLDNEGDADTVTDGDTEIDGVKLRVSDGEEDDDGCAPASVNKSEATTHAISATTDPRRARRLKSPRGILKIASWISEPGATAAAATIKWGTPLTACHENRYSSNSRDHINLTGLYFWPKFKAHLYYLI